VSPFSFPKTKHSRSQQPGQLGSYQAYKPVLRVEFARKCVYCRMPDSFSSDAFGVDHYRPVKHFPELKTSYPNLFYACNPCNSRKGSHWAVGTNAEGRTIPNPCDHVMVKHLRYRGEVVEPQSPAGEFTVGLLDLNRPANLITRGTMIHLLELSEARRGDVIQMLTQLRKRLRNGSLAVVEAEDAIARLEADLHRLERTITSLRGGS
jgi:hypothetical protein